jgi:hypothetical protein
MSAIISIFLPLLSFLTSLYTYYSEYHLGCVEMEHFDDPIDLITGIWEDCKVPSPPPKIRGYIFHNTMGVHCDGQHT